MKKRPAIKVYRERLKLAIAANCRSAVPSRKTGMVVLASEVGVFCTNKTLEPDLLSYIEQVKRPSEVKKLLDWTRDLGKGSKTVNEIPKLPHFQLELM